MHALHKILARASGTKRVVPGEHISAAIDLAEVNDLYLQVVRAFSDLGGNKVHDPDKLAFVFDHYAPAPTIKSAENQQEMRAFCRRQGIGNLFDVGCGVCHQVLPEAGLIYPGMVLIATDSHTTTHGVFGCFATGVGATDLAMSMIAGKLWFRVPEVVRCEINGKLRPGVMPKDVILAVLRRLGQDGAVYQAVEFAGEAVERMGIAGRMVLCNMAVEMGAQTTYIQPDKKVENYLEGRGVEDYELFHTDPGYSYEKEYVFDVDSLSPQVAIPHEIDRVVDVGEAGDPPVDQVLIGTCTGGRLEDIEMAAGILRGRKIASGVRLLVIPASREVMLRAEEAGFMRELIESGAVFATPGCGPCLGAHMGVISPGEVCVTTSSRNFPGRMGSTEAEIYAASPATAASSALAGRIADPREYLQPEKP